MEEEGERRINFDDSEDLTLSVGLDMADQQLLNDQKTFAPSEEANKSQQQVPITNSSPAATGIAPTTTTGFSTTAAQATPTVGGTNPSSADLLAFDKDTAAIEMRFGATRDVGDANEIKVAVATFTFDRLELNEHTHDRLPSISPREPLEDVEDKKLHREMKRFSQENVSMSKLILQMQKDILAAKPDNILDYLVDVWFADSNYKARRRQFY